MTSAVAFACVTGATAVASTGAVSIVAIVAIALSCLSLLIWCVLLFARGGFWRVRVPEPLAAAAASKISNTSATSASPATLVTSASPNDAHWPAVVAVVPARNEADAIGEAVASLLAQDYAGAFHVIVVDDHSTDGTADEARAAARRLQCPERLTVVTAQPLPAGWSGKVWAQSQGIAAARARGLPAGLSAVSSGGSPAGSFAGSFAGLSGGLSIGSPAGLSAGLSAVSSISSFAGSSIRSSAGSSAVSPAGSPPDWLLLTDADIGHPADALTQLVARAQAEGRDLVSLMVRLRCDSLWEKALIPAFVFFFAKLYPFAWVNDARRRTAAAAGGCMLVRRAALEDAGGIEAIRAELIDDCSLAARIKHRGAGHHPIRLDVAAHSVSLRPYDSWRDIWNMIARTAFTQLHYSAWQLVGTLVGMTLIYLVPPVVALGSGLIPWLVSGLTVEPVSALNPGLASGPALGLTHELVQWAGAGRCAGTLAAGFTGPNEFAWFVRSWPAWLAWAAMSGAYAPMLRYYRRSLLWAPALPLVALFYVGATCASAWRYWRGKGGQWKSRVQAPGQTR